MPAGVTIQHWDKLTDYWSRADSFHTTFYGNTMSWDRYLHIIRFLHFTDNKNEPNMKDENYDLLWKIRNLFDILNDKFSKIYNPSEHLAVDEVIVKFKGRVIFRPTYPRNTNVSGSKFTNCVTRLDTRMAWQFVMVWCWAMLRYHMLSGLPQLGISFKHFRPFKWTILLKIGTSAGNVRKINFKF